MKIIVYFLAGIGALVVAGLIFGGGGSANQRAGLAGLCPQIGQMAILTPDEKMFFRAILLNEADRLNNSGTCVIEGGLGRDSGLYYLAVRNHSGGSPYFKRYTEAELLALKP